MHPGGCGGARTASSDGRFGPQLRELNEVSRALFRCADGSAPAHQSTKKGHHVTFEAMAIGWLFTTAKVAGTVWIMACIILGTAYGIGAFWRGVASSLASLQQDKQEAGHER